MRSTPVIQSRLGEIRRRCGISAANLAERAGVSRQTVYAMEAGEYVPNTAIALRLARELGAQVEELFSIDDRPAPAASLKAEVLSETAPRQGQPLQLCRVGKHLLAIPPEPFPAYLPATDGIVRRMTRGKMAAVDAGAAEPGERLLIAGCDPAMSILERHAREAGIPVVLASCNSSRALQLLKAGKVHIAGSHLRDPRSGESNVPAVRKVFSKNAVKMIAFAGWEQGLIVAPGNPKEITGIEDVARPGVRFVNRETGSGARLLLDAQLRGAGIPAARVEGYDRLASGHLAAAWQVLSGEADCCVAGRAAANRFGLDFRPLEAERYDLVLRRESLAHPAVERLVEVLNRLQFRRELELLGGYDVSATGKVVA